MKSLDDVSHKMIDKYSNGNTASPTIDDLIKLQNKWRPLFRAARHPHAFSGQKYV